jgi:hypothetical protein
MPVCVRSRTICRIPAPDGLERGPGDQALVGQPLLQPAHLGGLPGALAALERDEHAATSEATPCGGVAAQRGDDVGQQGHRAAVVHLPVGQHADAEREQAGDEEHDPLAVDRDGGEPDVDLVLPDEPHAERHHGQRQDQRGPDEGLDDRERAPADLVLDLGAEQGEPGQVGDAGEEAHEDDEQQRDPQRERPGHEQHHRAGADDRDAEDALT